MHTLEWATRWVLGFSQFAGAVLGLWTASAALYGRVKRWFRTHREKPGNW